MIIQEWTTLDEAAEREAIALKNAKTHRSVFFREQKGGFSNSLSREQAVFDEHLEPHFKECCFCKKTLKPQGDEAREDGSPESEALHLEDCDVCPSCRFLATVTLRPAPAPSSSR